MGLTKGLVQVYTGDGKGKTTAAFGQVLRAVGRGLRVAVIQFLKGQETGEVLALKQFLPQVDIWRFGTEKFIIGRAATPEERALIAEGLAKARQALRSGDYDVIVMDEISHAVNLGLVSLADVVDLLSEEAETTEVIVTGRRMPEEIVERAHLVTEMRDVKHPYRSGIGSREGIEY